MLLVPSLLCALLTPAWAAGMHAGVPISGIDDALKPPRFQSARLGFTQDLPKGLLRVYVGPSEDAAAAWFVEMADLMNRHKPAPVENLGDQAVAAGDGMVLVRDGNVGVLVEAATGARSWADRVLTAIQPEPLDWPAVPILAAAPTGGWLAIRGDAVHLAWTGGRLSPSSTAPGADLQFTQPPRRLVVWDALGRAAVQDFDTNGVAIDTAPIRPNPDALTPAADPGGPR